MTSYEGFTGRPTAVLKDGDMVMRWSEDGDHTYGVVCGKHPYYRKSMVLWHGATVPVVLSEPGVLSRRGVWHESERWHTAFGLNGNYRVQEHSEMHPEQDMLAYGLRSMRHEDVPVGACFFATHQNFGVLHQKVRDLATGEVLTHHERELTPVFHRVGWQDNPRVLVITETIH